MKKIILIIILALSFNFQACRDSSENIISTGEIELISPQQVYNAIYNEDFVQLVDVRTKEEFIISHIKGAQNICVTDNDFDKKIKTLDKSKPVYLYCKIGRRSADAANKLIKMGFTKVFDMDGGILLWEKKKLKTEK